MYLYALGSYRPDTKRHVFNIFILQFNIISQIFSTHKKEKKTRIKITFLS